MINIFKKIEIKGSVRTYEDSLEIPFALVCIDTVETFKGFSNHHPLDSTNTNRAGNFSIAIKNFEKLNWIVTFMGYVPMTIKNIEKRRITG